MQGQNYFSKIGTATERDEVFRGISLINPKIYVFDSALNRLVFAIESIQGKEIIARLKKGKPGFEDETVTVNFSLKDNQYFMKSRCHVMTPKSDQRYHFDFSKDLFKLQRRANFRVKVPAKKNFRIEIDQLENDLVKLKFPVFDLSVGGMAILIPKDRVLVLSPGQKFKGRLVSGGGQEIELQGSLRYQRPAKGMSDFSHVAGFQFEKLAAKQEQHLLALVMDIYRDLFAST